jgi:hypothetical protein
MTNVFAQVLNRLLDCAHAMFWVGFDFVVYVLVVVIVEPL